MKSQRVNTRPGQRLEIVHPFASWLTWQAACSAGRVLGFALGIEVTIRAADTTGWKGRWVDGLPK